MERLMPISEWRDKRFTTPPDKRTIQKWCEKGEVPAKKIGAKWYIIVNEELNQTGDPLVDQVLSA